MKALLVLAALMPATAFAQQAEHAAVCVKAKIVPGFRAFGRPETGPLAIGKATVVTLRQETGPPAVTSGRAFKPGTYRGEITSHLQIRTAGRYRIAVSQKAWLALRRAGGEVESAAHDHGPPCSGIAKIVSFDLQPGRYALVLSEAATPAVTVMVVKD